MTGLTQNQANADVNVETDFGQTPLDIACSRPSNAELISILLSAGADPDHKDRNGKSTRMLAKNAGNLLPSSGKK